LVTDAGRANRAEQGGRREKGEGRREKGEGREDGRGRGQVLTIKRDVDRKRIVISWCIARLTSAYYSLCLGFEICGSIQPMETYLEDLRADDVADREPNEHESEGGDFLGLSS
jgi:hypothetical protein